MEKYQYSEEELKVIENSTVAIAVYQFIDMRVVTIALSNGFRELFGLSSLKEAYSLMDNDMYRDTHPDDVSEIENAAIRFAMDDAPYNIVYRTKIGNDYIIIHAIGKHVYKEDGTRLAVVSYTNEGVYDPNHTSTELSFNFSGYKYYQNKDSLHNLNFDHLTGLPDMNYFFKLAQSAFDRNVTDGKTMSMLFFNLSGMQHFNQKYGYNEGDQLIRAVAKLLAKTFSNYHCCRTTADHFAVYTVNEDIDSKLHLLIKDFKKINNGRNLPVKIGVYDSSIGHVGPAIATDRAKIACDSCGTIFHSKVVHFDKHMLKKIEDKRYIYENFEIALHNQWIHVHYQPIIRTSNGKVCNEEALVRWEDPTRGCLYPGDFIPVLDSAGMTYKLDLYVIDKVIEKLKKQIENDLPIVPNSINLSVSDFYSCDIVEELKEKVDQAGLDRSLIVLELKEEIIMDNSDYMKVQVDKLREYGFHVWLDDFGRGSSSPGALQKIHFDAIKLDRAYINQIEQNRDSKVIITEFVRLAKGLESETIAEGVEDNNTVNFLNEIGCNRVQGYYYSEALPYESLVEFNTKETDLAFENPNEIDYYSALSNLNLYDVSLLTEDNNLTDYFDTIPMFVVELKDNLIRHIKGNHSYKRFQETYYPAHAEHSDEFVPIKTDSSFYKALLKCKELGEPVIEDIHGPKHDVIHLYIRKIATNSENDAVALSVIILGYINNDSEIRHQEALERIKRERIIYSHVTALTGDFICLFAVNAKTNHYLRYVLAEDYKYVGLHDEGDDFFQEVCNYGIKSIYPDDQEEFLESFTKERILDSIEDSGSFQLNTRLRHNDQAKYVHMKITLTNEDDIPRFIVGIIDVDTKVRRDQKYSESLAEMNRLANFDALTGVKNKYAYADAETKLNLQIQRNDAPDFAIIVFDLNGLKKINDTFGHQAGDDFIKDGCKMICNYFQHSPVFRIGGDEFTVIAQGSDLDHLAEIMTTIEKTNVRNQREGKVVIASGASRFQGDSEVADVFKRADSKMYKNKRFLKGFIV
jgi:diguanylate cyclase (GGDEF)-like protein